MKEIKVYLDDETAGLLAQAQRLAGIGDRRLAAGGMLLGIVRTHDVVNLAAAMRPWVDALVLACGPELVRRVK